MIVIEHDEYPVTVGIQGIYFKVKHVLIKGILKCIIVAQM
jgi:hypothetical protein